jgi:hypothetical protein
MCPINNSDIPEINRGVELLLRKRREKKTSEIKQKKFGFSKEISLFRREIKINFYIVLLEKE